MDNDSGTTLAARLRTYDPFMRADWARTVNIPSDVVVVQTEDGRKMGAFVGSLRVASIAPGDRIATYELQTSMPLLPNEGGGKKYAERAIEIEEGLTRILATIPPEVDAVFHVIVRPAPLPDVPESGNLAEMEFPELIVTVQFDFGSTRRMAKFRRDRHEAFMRESALMRLGRRFGLWVSSFFKDTGLEELNLDADAARKGELKGLTGPEKVLNTKGHNALQRLIVDEIGEPFRSLGRATLANDPEIREALKKRKKHVGRGTHIADHAELDEAGGARERFRPFRP